MSRSALTDCRADFPALERQHQGRALAFLDGPAGSQVPQAVIEAIDRFYRTSNANTHGHFPVSRETDQAMWAARETVATFLGAAGPGTISFGPSMTSLNFSLSRALARDWKPGDEVVITALDHEANRAPWLRLQDEGIVVREVALGPEARLDPQDLEEKINERTRLVAMAAASNAVGTVNDLALARRLSSAVGAQLLVDAVHFAPHFAIDVASLDPDFLLCSAYKFYGPHVGILYCRPGLLDWIDTDRLRTQSQAAPYRIELGTLNHAAIVGVAAAVEYIASWGEGDDLRSRLLTAWGRIRTHEHEVASHYYQRIRQVPGVTVWGPDFSRPLRAPTVSITVEGRQAEEVAAQLGEEGLQVWDGHFYAIRAVEALRLEAQGGLVRAGVLMYNTREELDRLAEAVERLVA